MQYPPHFRGKLRGNFELESTKNRLVPIYRGVLRKCLTCGRSQVRVLYRPPQIRLKPLVSGGFFCFTSLFYGIDFSYFGPDHINDHRQKKSAPRWGQGDAADLADSLLITAWYILPDFHTIFFAPRAFFCPASFMASSQFSSETKRLASAISAFICRINSASFSSHSGSVLA